MKKMIATKGFAVQDAKSDLAPWNFERREVGPHDVQFDIQFCKVCHSDLHQIRDDCRLPQKIRHYLGAFFMERKVKYDYAFKLECVNLVSDKLNLAATAPLLCAGITIYFPLKFLGGG
jgi:D-arabinose 1-dehydrogenase-like Zn-dependent alcohol dehydrogenase